MERIIEDLSLRPFGLSGTDLNINFEALADPQLITNILQSCVISTSASKTESFFWKLTVGERIELLSLIAALSESAGFAVLFRCQNPNCGQLIELEIASDDLSKLQNVAHLNEFLTFRVVDHDLTLRRPTGEDQLRWQQYAFNSELSARETMFTSLIVEPDRRIVPDEFGPELDEAMQLFDPLIHFTLGVRCPDCGKTYSYDLDLQELLLDKLKTMQKRLINEIHFLASHYHWSEEQILALPPQRRRQYIALLEREKDR